MTKDLGVLKTLTKAQWIEVYNALPPGSPTQRLMKTDCRIESEGMSAADIRKLEASTRLIYTAIWQKLHNGHYSSDAEGRHWREDMLQLLDVLEPFAYCKLCGAEPGKPHQQDVNDGKTGRKLVTLHKWKATDGVYHRLCMHCRAGARQIPDFLTDKQVGAAEPEDAEDILATLKAVRDTQSEFLNALFELEAMSGIDSIDPAIDFRKVTVDQVHKQELPTNEVWTLLYSYPDGNDVWLFTTEAAARKHLAKLVRDTWDGENDAPEEAPEDDDQAIELYFYEGRENESYGISATTIEGPVTAQQPLPDGFIGPCLKCLTQCIAGGEGTVVCPKCKVDEEKAERKYRRRRA